MAIDTNISWCDSTFNPWIGCTKVGPGCDNCYAEALMDKRWHKVQWGTGRQRQHTSAANWRQPLLWEREHAAFALMHGRRRRVFCASLADVFDNEAPPQWRDELWSLVKATPHLSWLILTKRIGNVSGMAPADGLPANVWLGISVVNQAEADRDISKLLRVPAAVRFLSVEPMLGMMTLTDIPVGGGHGHHEFDPTITGNALKRADPTAASLHWVICGGESGPNARPMLPSWARSLRDQCAAADVPFLFKQWGEWISMCQDEFPDTPPPDRLMWADGQPFATGDGQRALPLLCRAGKAAAGDLLDGVEHKAWPQACRSGA